MLTLRQVVAACEDAERTHSASPGVGHYMPKNLASRVRGHGFYCLGVSVPVTKAGGRWVAAEADVTAAVQQYADGQAELRRVTDDFRRNIVYEGHHRIVGGSYNAGEDFYHVFNDLAAYRHQSYGANFCRRCHEPAKTEHNKPECHTCSDWGGCGGDCTLSAIYCARCETRKEL
jgi:hypothetical protein